MIKKTSFTKLKDCPEPVELEPHETPILVSGCPRPFNRLNGKWNNEEHLFSVLDDELTRNPLLGWKDVRIRINKFPSNVYLVRKQLKKSKVQLVPIGTITVATNDASE